MATELPTSLIGQKRASGTLMDDLREADFWPGTTFVLPVTHAEPAIAAAPLVNASRLTGTNPIGAHLDYFRIADNPPTILDQAVGIVPPSMM